MRSVINLIFLVLLPLFANSSWGMIVTSQPDSYLHDGNSAKSVANPVPATLARVVPGNINPRNLGTTADVFVTDAKALQGLNAKQIADKLTIPQSSSGFKVIEFPTPSSGIASPVFRNNPGFVGGGRTAGGEPEFVIPNGPVPAGQPLGLCNELAVKKW